MKRLVLPIYRPCCLLCFIAIVSHLLAQDVSDEVTIAKAVASRPSTRQLAWQARELETFIHFGLNTFSGTELGNGQQKPTIFAPTNINVAQWIATAKSFGSKGLVLVCKHSDGFCLWPSKTTDYSVAASPWRNGHGDLVKEVADLCRSNGLAFGVYLSPADLHQPSYGKDSETYGRVFEAQLKELLTEYGPISEVWFDGSTPNGLVHPHRWTNYYRLVRELQPGAVIAVRGPDVRWIGNESGYGRESEWSVVSIPTSPDSWDWRDMTAIDLGSRAKLKKGGFPVWYPAMSDVSLRRNWFWHPNSDSLRRNADDLLRIYEATVGHNAGLLLNLSPNTQGLIDSADMAVVQQFGETLKNWFAINLASDAESHWRQDTGTTNTAGMWQIQLARPSVANTLVLSEDIRDGQRVEQFAVLAEGSNGWQTVGRATTIGAKRILRLPDQLFSAISIVVEKSRGEPKLQPPALYYRQHVPSPH